MESKQAVTALAALAQSSRLALFRTLVQNAPKSIPAGELSSSLAIPKATLSFHLKELSHAGLISAEAIGRQKLYRANLDSMNALIDYLLENCCQGEPCGDSSSSSC